jgi:shikimate 5-dehydrogenase
MKGFPEVSPVPKSMFHPGQVVMDVIYNPVKTPFLKMAETEGAKVLLGIDMLIYQAMDSFEAWTGHAPPFEVMAKAAREAIG